MQYASSIAEVLFYLHKACTDDLFEGDSPLINQENCALLFQNAQYSDGISKSLSSILINNISVTDEVFKEVVAEIVSSCQKQIPAPKGVGFFDDKSVKRSEGKVTKQAIPPERRKLE